MRNSLIIAKRELMLFFNSIVAYIFLFVFLGFSYWFFFRGFFYYAQAEILEMFNVLPWSFFVFIPAITMRAFAEEKRSGTIEILMTYPVTECEFVFGKFLAVVIFIGITLILTLPLFGMICYLGDVDEGRILCGYFGSLLLGASYASLGLFASSLTKNQAVAFILGLIFCFVFMIIGEDIVRVTLKGKLQEVLYETGLIRRFDSMKRGVIDSRDIVFYFSFIGFFYYLTFRQMTKSE
ncbi:MAG: ABC transporter permease subunit [Candidatus Hydrogenedentota bacterium]